MSNTLSGLTPAQTFQGLIKVGNNTNVDGTAKVLSDGAGNDLPMEVSTTGVNFTNQLQQGGVAVPTASQVAAKQDTLVSGTNIKTINSTSLLGSGDISIEANPSGGAGSIQFSDGIAFASDSNLFWDNTNKRLGIGTNSPSTRAEIKSTANQLWLTNSSDIYTYLKFSATGGNVSMGFGDGNGGLNYINNYSSGVWASHKFAFGGSYFAPTARVHIKGSGSTSATTSLLVQNSSGTAALSVKDDLSTNVKTLYIDNSIEGSTSGRMSIISRYDLALRPNVGGISVAEGYSFNVNTSALIEMQSTTKGFLPPRMTTTQKNAISSPASGLMVYDTDTNKLCCYNGTSWNDLF